MISTTPFLNLLDTLGVIKMLNRSLTTTTNNLSLFSDINDCIETFIAQNHKHSVTFKGSVAFNISNPSKPLAPAFVHHASTDLRTQYLHQIPDIGANNSIYSYVRLHTRLDNVILVTRHRKFSSSSSCSLIRVLLCTISNTKYVVIAPVVRLLSCRFAQQCQIFIRSAAP